MDMFFSAEQKYAEKCMVLRQKTIYKLFQLRLVIHQCQFNSWEAKNRMLELIGEFIQIMNLSNSKFCLRDPFDVKEKYVIKLYQCLKKVQINNNIDILYRIIEEMNDDVDNCNNQNQTLIKQFVLLRSKQIRGDLYLNQNATFLVASTGCYAFNNNHKLIKKFTLNQREFSSFTYLQHSKQFLQGFYKRIIVCDNTWKPQQLLEGHTNWITSLIVNEEENLFISASQDRTIGFWTKNNSFWICQKILVTEFKTPSLSLNLDQTKLIAYGNIPVILFIDLDSNNQWEISQTLKVDIHGEYLSFISNNQFIFHPFGTVFLQTFIYSNETKKFIEGKQLLISNRYCSYGSECYYNNKTKELSIHYGQQIYLYHINENGDYFIKTLKELRKEDSLGRNIKCETQLLVIYKRMQDRKYQILFAQLRDII